MSSLDYKTEQSNHTVAIVLSGGAGVRVGGNDKGWVEFRGKPLIHWVVEALQPQVDTLLISANRNFDGYEKLGYSVVSDTTTSEERLGPLAGINAAFRDHQKQADDSAKFSYLICPCDTPLLPDNYVATLKVQMNSSELDVAVVHDGQRRQNLHSLICAKAMPSLIAYFENGGRSMHGWLETINLVDVDFSTQAQAFANYNRLQDLNS